MDSEVLYGKQRKKESAIIIMNLPLRQLQNVATGNYGKFGTQDQNDDLKDEMDNCIVDVCSTEEVEENSENIRPTSSTANSQSPKKKSKKLFCLSAKSYM